MRFPRCAPYINKSTLNRNVDKWRLPDLNLGISVIELPPTCGYANANERCGHRAGTWGPLGWPPGGRGARHAGDGEAPSRPTKFPRRSGSENYCVTATHGISEECFLSVYSSSTVFYSCWNPHAVEFSVYLFAPSHFTYFRISPRLEKIQSSITS